MGRDVLKTEKRSRTKNADLERLKYLVSRVGCTKIYGPTSHPDKNEMSEKSCVDETHGDRHGRRCEPQRDLHHRDHRPSRLLRLALKMSRLMCAVIAISPAGFLPSGCR